MRNERLAPGLDGEVHQRIHDAAFGATQSQSRGVFRHVARKAAVFEFAPTAALDMDRYARERWPASVAILPVTPAVSCGFSLSLPQPAFGARTRHPEDFELVSDIAEFDAAAFRIY